MLEFFLFRYRYGCCKDWHAIVKRTYIADMCKFHVSENTYAMQNMQYNYTVCSSITSQMHCTAQYFNVFFNQVTLGSLPIIGFETCTPSDL